MRILYITQLYPPMLYGGGEYIFSKWAEEMASRGHDIVVITQKIEGTPKAELINGVKIYRIPPEIQYRGALYSVSPFQNFGFLLHATLHALKIAKNYDLIHSNTFVPTLAAEAVGRLLGKPHIATIHDVYLQTSKEFWEKWSSQKDVNFIAKNAGHLIEKLILKLKPSKIHTVSLTSKRDLIKTGIKESLISVIPNGINMAEYRIPAGKNPFQVSYVGRLIFYKNIDTVIRAFKRVVEQLPEATLIIAGKGPYEQNLKDLTIQLGLQRNIIFTGRISDDEKVRLLSESQVMVQPSLVEGFGITVIESFACSTPVLASDVMPLPELVHRGENGMTITPFDKDKWADHMLDYLKSPEKCRVQGAKGKKNVKQKYTIEKVVDGLEDLYHSVLLAEK